MCRLGGAALLLAAALCGTGCQKALFSAKYDRTQFDQYDRLRGQYVSSTEIDAYGSKVPALRARLSPK